ncbi:hypothetical protein, partial [Vibrio parahaemolyticus]|uniref:hypothetical protein n=1 Tax=Vibrio parahaemolyticus TaxID=670 RepID=UPI001E593010
NCRQFGSLIELRNKAIQTLQISMMRSFPLKKTKLPLSLFQLSLIQLMTSSPMAVFLSEKVSLRLLLNSGIRKI